MSDWNSSFRLTPGFSNITGNNHEKIVLRWSFEHDKAANIRGLAAWELPSPTSFLLNQASLWTKNPEHEKNAKRSTEMSLQAS